MMPGCLARAGPGGWLGIHHLIRGTWFARAAWDPFRQQAQMGTDLHQSAAATSG